MNYPEEIREKYNECMYDERDIIEKFLKDQYDIRYGRQRDTWHFEPAIEMILTNGEHVILHDIGLDKNVLVKFFCEDIIANMDELECTAFAYGELSKVIEALPNASEIVIEDAKNDIAKMCKDCSIDLEDNPFKTFVNGLALSICSVNYEDGHIKAYTYTGKDVMDETNTGLVLGLRNHIYIEILRRSDEYKKVMELLSLQENLRFECKNYGDATFVIDETDMTFDVSSLRRDDKGNLVIYGGDIDADVCDGITLTEKEIKPQYLTSIIECMKPKYTDIMDTYNAHNPELVRKINDAWKSDKYHNKFSEILVALSSRDHTEFEEKFNCSVESDGTWAMEYAHEIMEGVCDDWDLGTILSFIRYEE